MGGLSSKEIAWLLDGLVQVGVAVFLAIIGLAIGWIGNANLFLTQYTAPQRKRHRTILWSIALGALAFSFAMFFMVEGVGFFSRSDGVVTEWAGWVGRWLLAVGVMWAFMESVFMTLQNSISLLVVVSLSYAGAIFANFVTTNEQYAITLVGWGVFWLVGLVLSIVWTNTSRSRFFLAYFSIGWIFLFSALQGLWLILGDEVADVSGFNNEVEGWLFFIVDILYTIGAAVLIGFSYFGNWPGIESPLYQEYRNATILKKAVREAAKLEAGAQAQFPMQQTVPANSGVYGKGVVFRGAQ